MRLLVFSDLHTDTAAAQRLVEQAAQADVVIGAGDFANVRRDLDRCLDLLRGVSRPAILVAGNNETTDELRAACQGWPSAHVLHGSQVTIDTLTFYGVGGGIPVTPFGDWSYDFSEDQAAGLLAGCPAGCVLVTHSPPYGVVDRSTQGRHLGSTAIREAALRSRPRLLVCGHIHASGGTQDTLESIPVVNAGPGGLIWQLADPH